MSMLPPEFRPFYEHVASGRLCFPQCEACRRFHWYPMPLCPHCLSDRIAWVQVAGTGRLFSWTVIRHAFDESRHHDIPYIVGLVDFPDAPSVRFITNIVDVGAQVLQIDLPVEAVLPARSLTDKPPLVRFRPSIIGPGHTVDASAGRERTPQ